MLWYSLEVPHRGTCNEYNIFFLEKKEKYSVDTPSYLELCRITRKPYLELAKAGINIEVVFFQVLIAEFYVLF